MVTAQECQSCYRRRSCRDRADVPADAPSGGRLIGLTLLYLVFPPAAAIAAACAVAGPAHQAAAAALGLLAALTVAALAGRIAGTRRRK